MCRSGASLYVSCNYAVAPVGEVIFSVLGTDRILYVAIDDDLGKEYAARVVKGSGWNVKKVKVSKKNNASICYFIPKGFAHALGLEKGSKVLVVGYNCKLEVIPISIVLKRLGCFKDPLL